MGDAIITECNFCLLFFGKKNVLEAVFMASPYAAMILAAGRGQRLSGGRGKAFVHLAACPMIWHVRQALLGMTNPPQHIVIVCHPDDQSRMEHEYGTQGDVIAIQPSPQGTADAVQTGLAAITEHDNSINDVLIVPTDMPLITSDFLTRLVSESSATNGVLAVMTPRSNVGYGRVMCDKRGKAVAIIEEKDCDDKSRTIPLVYAGIMMVAGSRLREVMNDITPSPVTGEYYLTRVASLLAQQSDYALTLCEGDEDIVQGVNDINQWQQAETLMQQRLRASQHHVMMPQPQLVSLAADTRWGSGVVVHPFVFMGQGVVCEQNVTIHSFCHLADVHIGEHCEIGPFARLRGHSTIGRASRIGNFVEGKNVKMDEEVKAAHLSYLGDCTIGASSNIGASVITCNYDGRNKHETHIGARAFVGSHASLIAPVTIGDGAVVGAGSVITQDVNHNHLAIARAPQLNKKRKNRV